MEVGANFGFASIARIALSGEALRGTGGFTFAFAGDDNLMQSKYHLFEDQVAQSLPAHFIEHLKEQQEEHKDCCFFVQRTVSDLHVYRCKRDDATEIVRKFFESVTIDEIPNPGTNLLLDKS